VYIADLEAKKLMDSPEIKNAILAILGAVFDSNHLVRAKLAEIVLAIRVKKNSTRLFILL
jgi:hypothetical protein